MAQDTKNLLENKVKHEIEFTVRAHQVDHTRQLKSTALGDMLIVISQEHSMKLDISVEKLMRSGKSWVLGRMTMEMERWPMYSDKIKISTWIEHVGKFKSVRMYKIELGDEKIGEAYTLWSMFDLIERKPVDLEQLAFMKELALNIQSENIYNHVSRLKAEGKSKRMQSFCIQYSDIDILAHMYSIRYLEHAMDYIDFDRLSQEKVSVVEMNFLQELNHGQEVHVQRYSDNRHIYIVFFTETIDRPAFISKFQLEKSDE